MTASTTQAPLSTPPVAITSAPAPMPANSLPIALSMGDPAGIGPEIIVKAWQRLLARAATMGTHPLPLWVAGSAAVFADLMAAHAPEQQMEVVASAQEALTLWRQNPRNQALVLVDVGVSEQGLLPGCVSAVAGQLAGRAIAIAAEACLAGQARALVTAPIHKVAFELAGYPYPGHTEYLQALAARHVGCEVAQLPVRMLLANDELQTVLLSIHVSLREALDRVTLDNLGETLRLTHTGVLQGSGLHPRIAVAGVNPHAGESGRFGREEIDIMTPAIAQAQAAGIDVVGPISPDTVFMRARRGEFDVVVAAYHDQGLIPVKYMGVDDGVNVTLGLPFVRCSPDHGTAFDIAGQGVASPQSLLKAIEWAMRGSK